MAAGVVRSYGAAGRALRLVGRCGDFHAPRRHGCSGHVAKPGSCFRMAPLCKGAAEMPVQSSLLTLTLQ